MPEQHITAISWNERNRRVAQVWILGGHKVAEVEMPPHTSRRETWNTAVWLYNRVVEQELAKDHRDTIDSIRAASYPI
jgi:hypothetical protein